MLSFNRANIIDENFIKILKEGSFPNVKSSYKISSSVVSADALIGIFESQIYSRHMDLEARALKDQGQCHYTIASSGHEGNAVFGKVFSLEDMAFLHYRSGAFYFERSKHLPGSSPLYDMALSFVGSSDDPISGGRHKVIGSESLNIPPQTSTIGSHIPKAVATAFSIDRARDLKISSPRLKKDSVVLCSFGDASVNHATSLSGFNTASYISYSGGNVPIVFLCEDNQIGISVPSPRKWIENNFSNRNGIKYIQADGRNIIDLIIKSRQAELFCRNNRSPVFFHMHTVRLMGHAGSDVELTYRTKDEIERSENDDPLLHSARILIENNCLSKEDILNLYESSRERVNYVFQSAILRPKIKNSKEVMSSLLPKATEAIFPKFPNSNTRKKVFGKEFDRINNSQSMAKLINYCLIDLMLRYSNILLFGEDVSRKGGVYNVTSGLLNRFGYKRVFDSPLDETSIIAFGIGFGMNGFIPIIEIQFLAYIHNAEDQLRGEAATLSFFSDGRLSNPMVIRVPGLAYQKGFGGHFHNDNSLAIFRDIPGIIVAVPSNGRDAVSMLRTAVKEAYENHRIVVFIEPIALYMEKDLYNEKDGKWSFKYPELMHETPLGDFSVYGKGNNLAIITYGNGLFLSLKAKKSIEKKIKAKIMIIDLRWLTDIDYVKLKNTISDCSKVLIVDECRRSGCYGEGIYNELISSSFKKEDIKLHAAEDSFISIGTASTFTLPSKNSIINESLTLLDE